MAKKIKIKKRRNGTVTALMKPEVERHFCSSGGSGEEAVIIVKMPCMIIGRKKKKVE